MLPPTTTSRREKRVELSRLVANDEMLPLVQVSELGRRRVEQKRSSKDRESVGEKAGRSCLALTWLTAGDMLANLWREEGGRGGYSQSRLIASKYSLIAWFSSSVTSFPSTSRCAVRGRALRMPRSMCKRLAIT